MGGDQSQLNGAIERCRVQKVFGLAAFDDAGGGVQAQVSDCQVSLWIGADVVEGLEGGPVAKANGCELLVPGPCIGSAWRRTSSTLTLSIPPTSRLTSTSSVSLSTLTRLVQCSDQSPRLTSYRADGECGPRR